ncbi:MAG: collagen binding domain-containing protein [Pseudoruminococcus massiliensis]|uniref:MSCRAMM family protein n=1 Tax=Pseudoruminococcus massiliensis TaxID=2086583 RepID=UPI003996BBEC
MTIGKVDEVVEIELVNYFIKGNIEMTKVDKDYPDNHLSGAVFEVYSDTNTDGKLDKDDKLLGEMTELDGGIYQMKELRYGKYLVREKTAPTGFVLDEKVSSLFCKCHEVILANRKELRRRKAVAVTVKEVAANGTV